MNPNDDIRAKMLQYFYDRAQKARSKTGKYGYAVKISDLKADLKALHELSQPQVIANLQYLVDRGWVSELPETKQVPTRGGMVVPSTTMYYAISAEGTDKIEGGSEFQRTERFAGINIDATGSNVITLGDGNVVNVEYRQLFSQLTELRHQIVGSGALSDEQKFSTVVDIDTLRDQLAKPEPDRQIVQRLWAGIDKMANIAGLAGFAVEVGKAVAQLVG